MGRARERLLHDAVAKGDVGRQPCQPLLQPGRDDLARLRVDGRARLQHVLHLRARHTAQMERDIPEIWPGQRGVLPRGAVGEEGQARLGGEGEWQSLFQATRLPSPVAWKVAYDTW